MADQPHEYPQGYGYQQPQQSVIQQQPGAPGQMSWIPAPQAPMGCPQGLEYLLAVNQILIHKTVDLVEVFTGCERKNKYRICNTMSQQVYFALEETDCCTRLWCGPGRAFEMTITDSMQREVIHLSRPVRCQCCWWPCCLQVIEVQAPPGTVIGYVQQKPTPWKPKLEVQDAQHQHIMTINGPCCLCACLDMQFPVSSADGSSEIMITKQWTGCTRETFTDAANFGIQCNDFYVCVMD